MLDQRLNTVIMYISTMSKYMIIIIVLVTVLVITLKNSPINDTIATTNVTNGDTHTEESRDQLNLPQNIIQVLPWQPTEYNSNASKKSLKPIYDKLLNTMELICLHRTRVGSLQDGGWDMCLAGPYMPRHHDCLVYSFGINNDWSFDDDMTDTFNCTLRAFDPTMSEYQEKSQRGDFITFYPLGLSGHNGIHRVHLNFKDTGETFAVKNFDEILNLTGDQGKVIDYMKMDIEDSEWLALPQMIKSGVLQKYVKQLALEFHAHESSNFSHFIAILNSLGKIGFRKWLVSWNMVCQSSLLIGTDCYEVYFINVNFFENNKHVV